MTAIYIKVKRDITVKWSINNRLALKYMITMEEKKVIQKNNGVEIIMPGTSDIDDVNATIQSCSSGKNSCCSGDFLKNNKIGVYEVDGHAVIKIQGNVSKNEIEEKINKCSCFDK